MVSDLKDAGTSMAKRAKANKVNIHLLQVYFDVQILSRNLVSQIPIFSFLCDHFNKALFLCKLSYMARYFSLLLNLKADSISVPCSPLMIQ